MFLQGASSLKDLKNEINELSKLLFNIIFNCFYPDMLLDVIENKGKKSVELDHLSLRPKDPESKYVYIEKIEKLEDKN